MTAAGFYHCSVKGVGRAAGRSIVAAAAYRSGQRLLDARTGETFDYRARGGVEDTFIVTATSTPAWAQDRAQLWNEAERAEPRANGRLATELELALPHELDAVQRRELVAGFVREIVDRYGVAADVAIHAPGKDGDHRNHHAHVLLTHRELGPEGFGDIANTRTVTRKRKGREVQEQVAGVAATPADVKAIRKAWEQDLNRAYEQAGLDIRADHRSHKDRGIEAEPTTHLGPNANGMERRGEFSDRGDTNREITERNAERERLAELAAEAAALKIELAAAMAARHAEEIAARNQSPAAASGPFAELQPEPEIMRVFDAAARQTTEPAAPIFDRDQADREWQEKLEAAAVATDAAKSAPEARHSPEPAAGMDAPAKTAEPPTTPQIAADEANFGAAAELRDPDRAAGRLLGGLARVAEILGEFLFGSFMAPPKDTKAQAEQKAQARGNEENLHADDYAAHVQAKEAEHDDRMAAQKKAEQEGDLRLARTLGILATRESSLNRSEDERPRDRDYERDR